MTASSLLARSSGSNITEDVNAEAFATPIVGGVLTDIRMSLSAGRMALVMDLRTADDSGDANMAVLIADQILDVRWAPDDIRVPATAWNVLESRLAMTGDILELQLLLYPDGELAVRCREATLALGSARSLHDRPDDLSDNRGQLPSPGLETAFHVASSLRLDTTS